MLRRLTLLTCALLTLPCPAQLPSTHAIPEADEPYFRATVDRIEKSLATAPDPATVTYELARTWGQAKQWPEAIQWLQRAVAFKTGLDPARDYVFEDIRDTQEFKSIAAAAREATQPVSHSTPAFTVSEGDLVPESIAYDAKSKFFYFGSMRKGKVIRCSRIGECAQFATGLDTILGLKIGADGLWLLNNSNTESDLIHYDVTSGAVVRKYAVNDPGHSFNDLAIAANGDLYISDTRANAVWVLSQGAAGLTKLPDRFPAANGIALSADQTVLYVATFPDGITLLDLRTHTTRPIPRPKNLCLATIDGLYFYNGALIAIQNGIMSPRVVRLKLAKDLRAIEGFDVLERHNPLFDGITTGVIAGGDFYYMANIQDEKEEGFRPITILKVHF
jgi:hypothetical protein